MLILQILINYTKFKNNTTTKVQNLRLKKKKVLKSKTFNSVNVL